MICLRDFARTVMISVCVVIGLYIAHLCGVVYCPIRLLTGYPCPTCGTVRGTLQFLSGDFAGALARQPLGVLSALIGVPLMLALSLFPALRQRIGSFDSRHGRLLIVLGVVALLANWGYVLCHR